MRVHKKGPMGPTKANKPVEVLPSDTAILNIEEKYSLFNLKDSEYSISSAWELKLLCWYPFCLMSGNNVKLWVKKHNSLLAK